MAEKLLGPEFEIHGGGLDLRFPHHENELAQSRGAGRPFARVWAHNGMLELAEEKMSKSLGNIVSLREVLDAHGRDAILLFFLTGHYRSPLEYSDEALEAAAKQAQDLRTAFRVVERPGEEPPAWEEFATALDDDFSTPLALSILHAWRSAGELDLLERGLAIFGLGLERAGEAPPDVVRRAEERENARAARDFARADELRAEIEGLGWEVQDSPGGFRLIPRT
jgi:cysteinyl-tRNA synthetase